MMKAMMIICLAAASLFVTTGCSWIRIADSPTYNRPPMHHGVCGIKLSENEVSMQRGPKIVERLRTWNLFDSIVFPYREGDDVDQVMLLTLEGGFHDAGSGGNGFIIGLSLFTLSPFIGAKMKGEYSAYAIISEDGKQKFTCRVEDQQTIEWGLGANTTVVGLKAENLAADQLAFRLAQCLVEKLK